MRFERNDASYSAGCLNGINGWLEILKEHRRVVKGWGEVPKAISPGKEPTFTERFQHDVLLRRQYDGVGTSSPLGSPNRNWGPVGRDFSIAASQFIPQNQRSSTK